MAFDSKRRLWSHLLSGSTRLNCKKSKNPRGNKKRKKRKRKDQKKQGFQVFRWTSSPDVIKAWLAQAVEMQMRWGIYSGPCRFLMVCFFCCAAQNDNTVGITKLLHVPLLGCCCLDMASLDPNCAPARLFGSLAIGSGH